MAGRRVHRQRKIAEADDRAIGERFAHARGRRRIDRACLRIAGRDAAATQRQAGRGSQPNGGAGLALERRHAADMIEVLVGGEHQLDLVQPHAEPADVARNDRGGLGGTGVDQHRAAIAADQQHGDAAGADIVDRTEDMQRRRGIGPAVMPGTGAAVRGDGVGGGGGVRGRCHTAAQHQRDHRNPAHPHDHPLSDAAFVRSGRADGQCINSRQ